LPSAWDTTLVSELRPGSDADAHVLRQAARGEPVAVAAVSLFEAAYGYARAGAERPAFANLLRWLSERADDPAVLTVIPFAARAAMVAGRLRALHPAPPAPRRHDRRPKTERRAAWVLDLQIAATCWAAGYEVATRNRSDFETIADLVARIAPQAARLGVTPAPF
jgi:predicted nucleic acid-binding protein